MDAVVAPGEKFVLYLPRTGTEAGDPLPLLCTAGIRSRLKTHGKFRTGGEFTDPAEAEADQTSFGQSADGLTARAAGDAAWCAGGAVRGRAGARHFEPDAPRTGTAHRAARGRRSGVDVPLPRRRAPRRAGDRAGAQDSRRPASRCSAQPLKAGEEFVKCACRARRRGADHPAVSRGQHRRGGRTVPDRRGVATPFSRAAQGAG